MNPSGHPNAPRWPRPTVRVGQRNLPAFQVCGLTGLACSIVLTFSLVLARDRSPWVMTGIVIGGVTTFLALAMITKIVTGKENLVYYHHEIAVIVVTASWLAAIGQPVLPYLDITILGIGAFLMCGRVGCLMVGCCHGRPARWGVRYGPEHVVAGFNPHFLRARLIPIQAVESVWVATIVSVGSLLILNDAPAGTALAWYVVAYDIGRFGFEFFRGDPIRPYHGGFSSPQWVSLLLMLVVVGLELRGVLPSQPWHGVATVALVAVMATLAVHRHRHPDRYGLRHPAHVAEIAAALDRLHLDAPPAMRDLGAIDVATTSLGVFLSGETLQTAATTTSHVAVSRKPCHLTAESAATIARLIAALRGHSRAPTVQPGPHGVFHVLMPTPESRITIEDG